MTRATQRFRIWVCPSTTGMNDLDRWSFFFFQISTIEFVVILNISQYFDIDLPKAHTVICWLLASIFNVLQLKVHDIKFVTTRYCLIWYCLCKTTLLISFQLAEFDRSLCSKPHDVITLQSPLHTYITDVSFQVIPKQMSKDTPAFKYILSQKRMRNVERERYGLWP